MGTCPERIWRLHLAPLGHPATVNGAGAQGAQEHCLVPRRQLGAAASDGGEWSRRPHDTPWDLDRGECLHVFKGHKCAVQCLSVDWARMRVLSGSEDKTLRVWYLDRKAFLQELNPAQGGSPGTIPVPHADTVWCVAADWCSQTAISGSGDGSLRLWDLETGFCLKQWRGHSSLVQCVSF